MRQILFILALLGAIVGAAFWYYQTRFHPVLPVDVRVDSVTGKATQGQKGNEVLLKTGDVLKPGSRVVTAEDSVVRLGVESGEQVDLLAGSELTIDRVSTVGVDFKLTQGRLAARVKRYTESENVAPRTLRVGVAGNPARVATADGAFVVQTDGWGTLDVGVEEGDVNLEGVEGAGAIPAGERRVIGDKGESLVSGQVPRSVLLKVEWPEEGVRRASTVEIAGEVTPGSRVEVGGQVIRPEKNGRFKATVPLQEGPNQVEVKASGLGEPTVSKSPPIVVDTRPPRVQSNTERIWK